MDILRVIEALASARRLQILDWLRDPCTHFPPQQDGDLVEDGVCVGFIADKLGVAQPTATSHLQILKRAGLLTSTRVGQWTFYKRDENGIATAGQQLQHILDPRVVSPSAKSRRRSGLTKATAGLETTIQAS
jgi:ArsR family transcriptional regulator